MRQSQVSTSSRKSSKIPPKIASQVTSKLPRVKKMAKEIVESVRGASTKRARTSPGKASLTAKKAGSTKTNGNRRASASRTVTATRNRTTSSRRASMN